MSNRGRMTGPQMENWVRSHVTFSKKIKGTGVQWHIIKNGTQRPVGSKEAMKTELPPVHGLMGMIEKFSKKWASQHGLVRPKGFAAAKAKTVAAAKPVAVRRYRLTNNGWVNNRPNQPNRNNAKAENNKNNKNENSANNGVRHSIYDPLTRAKISGIASKVISIAALVPRAAAQDPAAFVQIHAIQQSLKGITQGSTLASYSGSVLETAAFDMAAVANDMRVVYFSQDLGGRLANLPKTGPPVMVLKSRFTFTRSIKSARELATPMGKKVWLPIIRAGSDNPFYYVVGGQKTYVSVLPVPFGHGVPAVITNPPGPAGNVVIAMHGTRAYFATPFKDLVIKKGEKLYKGYTAVEPDVLIWIPNQNKLKIVELKIGPGKPEATPGEAYQLLKAKRSIQYAFSDAGRPPPKIEMFFVPWFYSKIRGGQRPQFTNIYGPGGVWNKRMGHELTKKIPDEFSGPIETLDTPRLVEDKRGINAKVASMVLDTVRLKDFTDVGKLIKHFKTHGTFFSNSTQSDVNSFLRAAGMAHPAHGRASSAARMAQPGGMAYSARLTARAERRGSAPMRMVAKAKKTVAQLVEAGVLVAKRGGNYWRPGTLRAAAGRGTSPQAGYLSSSASNVEARPPANRAAAVAELIKRFREFNRILGAENAKGQTGVPEELVNWWKTFDFRVVNNNAERKKIAGIYNTFKSARSPKTAHVVLTRQGLNNRQVLSAFKRVYGPSRGQQIFETTRLAARASSGSMSNNNVNGPGNLFR